MVVFLEDYKLFVFRLLIEIMGLIFVSFVMCIDIFIIEVIVVFRVLVGGIFFVYRFIGEGWFCFYVKRFWLILKCIL